MQAAWAFVLSLLLLAGTAMAGPPSGLGDYYTVTLPMPIGPFDVEVWWQEADGNWNTLALGQEVGTWKEKRFAIELETVGDQLVLSVDQSGDFGSGRYSASFPILAGGALAEGTILENTIGGAVGFPVPASEVVIPEPATLGLLCLSGLVLLRRS